MVGLLAGRRRRGIFAYGDALFHGSAGATHLNAPIVGMAATPDGGATGWSPPTGDLRLRRRSLPRVRRRQPAQQAIVGMAATLMVGLLAGRRRRGIFAYGDALFHGSAGASPLKKPIVGMVAPATPTGSTTSWWVPALGNQPWQWEIDHPLDLSNATDMARATRCPTAHPPPPGDL